MDRNKIEQPVVISIGTNEVGKIVIRVRYSDKSIRDYATDLKSFADMAARNVRVFNAK